MEKTKNGIEKIPLFSSFCLHICAICVTFEIFTNENVSKNKSSHVMPAKLFHSSHLSIVYFDLMCLKLPHFLIFYVLFFFWFCRLHRRSRQPRPMISFQFDRKNHVQQDKWLFLVMFGMKFMSFCVVFIFAICAVWRRMNESKVATHAKPWKVEFSSSTSIERNDAVRMSQGVVASYYLHKLFHCWMLRW